MRSMFRNVGLVVSLLFLLWGNTVFGQSPIGVKWEIPFSFSVGNTLLPAGEYVTRLASARNNNRMVLLTERGTGKSVFLFTDLAQNPRLDGTSKMVFLLDDGKYTLAQIQDSIGVRTLTDAVPKLKLMASAKPNHTAANSTKKVVLKAS